jgi:hypothetical protein
MCRAGGEGDLFVSIVHAAKLIWTNKLRTQCMNYICSVHTLHSMHVCVGVMPKKYTYLVCRYVPWIHFYLTKICEHYYCSCILMMSPG